MYLALEPYVRRRWPWRVVAWNRLLEGRFRDPLVGRDLLVGGFGGVCAPLLEQLQALAPTALGGAAQAPANVLLPAAFSNVPGTVSVLLTSVLLAMGQFFLLFVLPVVLRREWLAAAAWVLIGTTLSASGAEGYWGAEHRALNVVFAGLGAVMLLVFLLRFGLLTLAVVYVFGVALAYVPLTADRSAWYAGTGLVYALLAGLAVYGFVLSLGGRSLFRGELLGGGS
jgi:serine/threonine-protein kinase